MQFMQLLQMGKVPGIKHDDKDLHKDRLDSNKGREDREAPEVFQTKGEKDK